MIPPTKKQAKTRLLYTEEDEKRALTIPNAEGVAAEGYRTAWRRDYARLIHSPAFRRLQGKTQLFPGVETDFFRNRLTHSLEVAQIAKSILITHYPQPVWCGTNSEHLELFQGVHHGTQQDPVPERPQ